MVMVMMMMMIMRMMMMMAATTTTSFFRSQVSPRRELPRRRLGLRRRARGSGTPDAVTRPRQRPWQGLGSARNERPSVRAAAEPQRAVQKARWAPYRLSKSKDSISHAPDTAEKKAWAAAHLLKSWALNRSLPPEAGPPITREETSSLASQPASSARPRQHPFQGVFALVLDLGQRRRLPPAPGC